MAKLVDQFSTLENFRTIFNDVSANVGDKSGLRTEKQETLVDAINSVEDKSFFFQEFVYTATAGQTIFSGVDIYGNELEVKQDRLQVYVNSDHKNRVDDYTIGGFGALHATTYSNVQLQSAASAGDKVVVYSYTGSYLGTDASGNTTGFFSTTAAGDIHNNNTGGVVINGNTDPTITSMDSGYDIQLSGNNVKSKGNVTLDAGKTLTSPTITDSTLTINTGNITGGVTGTFSSTVQAGGLYSTAGATVDGASVLNSTLSVTGLTSLNGGLQMDTNKFTVANTTGDTVIAGTTQIAGLTSLNGGLQMDTNKFTVANTTGNTHIAGDLNVDGLTTLNGTTIDGDLDLNGSADISTNLSVHGDVTLGDASTDDVTVTGSLASDITIKTTNTYDIGTSLKKLSMVHSTGFTGELTGNASTATILATTRAISLTGDVVGTVNFNGSSPVSMSTTIQANSVALGTDTTGNYVIDVLGGTGIDVTHTTAEGSSPSVAIDSSVVTLTGTQILTNKTLTSAVLNTGVSGTAILDSDTMSGASATTLSSSESIKAYVDAQVQTVDNTDEMTEGSTNLYHTSLRVDARIGLASLADLNDVNDTGNAIGKVLGWNGSAWGPVDQSTSTDSVTEGVNKYFTDDRVAAIFKMDTLVGGIDTEINKGIKLSYNTVSSDPLNGRVTAELDYDVVSTAPSSVGSTVSGHLWFVI